MTVSITVKYFFGWISYETYCLKLLPSRKLILTQISQNKSFIFLNENKSKVEKNRKQKS